MDATQYAPLGSTFPSFHAFHLHVCQVGSHDDPPTDIIVKKETPTSLILMCKLGRRKPGRKREGEKKKQDWELCPFQVTAEAVSADQVAITAFTGHSHASSHHIRAPLLPSSTLTPQPPVPRRRRSSTFSSAIARSPSSPTATRDSYGRFTSSTLLPSPPPASSSSPAEEFDIPFFDRPPRKRRSRSPSHQLGDTREYLDWARVLGLQTGYDVERDMPCWFKQASGDPTNGRGAIQPWGWAGHSPGQGEVMMPKRPSKRPRSTPMSEERQQADDTRATPSLSPVVDRFWDDRAADAEAQTPYTSLSPHQHTENSNEEEAEENAVANSPQANDDNTRDDERDAVMTLLTLAGAESTIIEDEERPYTEEERAWVAWPRQSGDELKSTTIDGPFPCDCAPVPHPSQQREASLSLQSDEAHLDYEGSVDPSLGEVATNLSLGTTSTDEQGDATEHYSPSRSDGVFIAPLSAPQVVKEKVLDKGPDPMSALVFKPRRRPAPATSIRPVHRPISSISVPKTSSSASTVNSDVVRTLLETRKIVKALRAMLFLGGEGEVDRTYSIRSLDLKLAHSPPPSSRLPPYYLAYTSLLCYEPRRHLLPQPYFASVPSNLSSSSIDPTVHNPRFVNAASWLYGRRLKKEELIWLSIGGDDNDAEGIWDLILVAGRVAEVNEWWERCEQKRARENGDRKKRY